MKSPILLLATAAFFAVGAMATDDGKKAPDNSAKNARDKSGVMKTPTDQSNDPADLQITKEIRQAVVKDKTLSVTAKNVKIITTPGGNVTLRGPVDSAEERARIIAIAKGTGGVHTLAEQLEVKTK
jgi:hyperosmotically inducible protein